MSSVAVASPYMTVEECAEYIRSTPKTVYKWKHQGRIPAEKVHGKLLFLRSAIDAWIQDKNAPRRSASNSHFRSIRDKLIARSLTTEHIVNAPSSIQRRGGRDGDR